MIQRQRLANPMAAGDLTSGNDRAIAAVNLVRWLPHPANVDLKRPGRVDVKIPILPTSTPEEGFALLRALCKKRGLAIDADAFASVRDRIQDRLTPAAAEALSVKAYRLVRTAAQAPLDALAHCLDDYRPAVPPDVMELQIQLAVAEASDTSFIPPAFRGPGA